MQLTPKYDDPDFFRIDVTIDEPARLVIQQRARLESTVEGFTDEQWSTPSRCEGWSVKDVIAHLTGTNRFWTMSIASAVGGTPTKFLTTFDPVASPAQMVSSTRSIPAADVFVQFSETNDELADVIDAVGGSADWDTLGEAPPGHMTLTGVALHALWDSWVHERDIALPLGLDVAEDREEIGAALAYAVGLGPALGVSSGSSRAGTIAVSATDPDLELVVDIGSNVTVRPGEAGLGSEADGLRLAGPAVPLLEALSCRGPMPCEIDEHHRWLATGVATVFDRNV